MMFSHQVERPSRELSLPRTSGSAPMGNPHVQRAPDLRSEEAPWQDANNGEGNPFDGDAAADDVVRAAVAPLPQVVADHRHRTIRATTAHVVRFGDRPSAEPR